MTSLDNILNECTHESYDGIFFPEETLKRNRDDECLEVEQVKRNQITSRDNNSHSDYLPLSESSLFSPIDVFDSQESLSPLSSKCMLYLMESLFEDDDNKKINKNQLESDDEAGIQQQQDYMSPLQTKVISDHALVQSPKEQSNKGKTSTRSNHVEWTVNEDSKLLDLHHEYGNQWATIARYLPGKSRIEVKTRYRSFRRAAKRFWSISQDKLLMNLYVQYGYDWNDEIAARFPTKTKMAIKNRLNELLHHNAGNRYHAPSSPFHVLSSRPEAVDELLDLDN